ncbi:MAG TPA: hypothetical protein PLQ64_07190 [Thiobacillaceae bacterium]|nr:hypothetical protein [Thiobacillaceae bacterium]HNI06966.1 hypothetical protein [Thiobacillaceae bacterium]
MLALRGLEGLARSPLGAGFLKGVRPAAVALVAVSGLLMLPDLPNPALSLPAFFLALILLLAVKLPTYWLILLAGLAGMVLTPSGTAITVL